MAKISTLRVIAVAAVAALLLIEVACGPSGSTSPASNVSTTTADGDWKAAAARASVPLAVAVGSWDYQDAVDPMTSGHTMTACVTSLNKATQSEPYSDASADLCIRRSPRSGLNVYLRLNGEGQVLCDLDECSVPVRFEKRPMHRFPGTSPADGSTTTIFIEREAEVVRGLKSAASTTVEIQLYQNGTQALVFPTAGLKWP